MKILSLFVVALMSFSVHAKNKHKDGVFGLINYSEFEQDGVSYDNDFGFGMGWTRYYDMNPNFTFRTGAGLVGKNSVLEGTPDKQVDILYLEIPLTGLFMLSPQAGLFGGLNMNLKQMASESADFERFVFTLVLGGHFIAGKNSVIEPYLELGIQDIADETELKNSLGLKYVYFY
jgi:hypothetical protein